MSSQDYAGLFTGQTDDNGEELKCGDRIRFIKVKPGYRETTVEDGWGRTRLLCSHDQYWVPEETIVSDGTIEYSASQAGFIVKWDSAWPDTTPLYMTGHCNNSNEQRFKLEVEEEAERE